MTYWTNIQQIQQKHVKIFKGIYFKLETMDNACTNVNAVIMIKQGIHVLSATPSPCSIPINKRLISEVGWHDCVYFELRQLFYNDDKSPQLYNFDLSCRSQENWTLFLYHVHRVFVRNDAKISVAILDVLFNKHVRYTSFRYYVSLNNTLPYDVSPYDVSLYYNSLSKVLL